MGRKGRPPAKHRIRRKPKRRPHYEYFGALHPASDHVNRQAGANAVEVAQRVKDLLPAFQKQLPGSVNLIPLYDRSRTIVANADPLLRPDPVLQISTGATKNNQGQYAFTISGVDAKQVYQAARDMIAKCHQYAGFQSVSSDYFANTPTLAIKLNQLQLQSYGLSNMDVEKLLKNAYAQNYTYLIKTSVDQYQVIVEAEDTQRSDPANLNQLYYKPSGGQSTIPNRTVTDPAVSAGMLSVNHLNQFPVVTLFFNLKPGVSTGEATSFIQRTAATTLPSTIRGQLQGEAKTFSETFAQLGVLVFVAVFVMYVILGILYESWFHPITVLSSLPVATVGGLLTLFLFQSELSLSTPILGCSC